MIAYPFTYPAAVCDLLEGMPPSGEAPGQRCRELSRVAVCTMHEPREVSCKSCARSNERMMPYGPRKSDNPLYGSAVATPAHAGYTRYC